MGDKTKVMLIGPAKIDGEWKKVGDEPSVDAVTLQQLQDAGVVGIMAAEGGQDDRIALSPGAELIFTQAEFDAAVEAKSKEMAGAAFDGALADLEAELKTIVADAEKLEAKKAAAIKRAEDAEGALARLKADTTETVDRLQARNAELEATIAKLTPPPEAAPAAKKAKGA